MINLQKLTPILVVVAILGVGAGGYFYNQYQKTNKELQTIKTDPSTVQKAAKEEVKKLLEEVGKLIALPTGEEPTVATVTDVEKLKDQPFFKDAKNGDKVIIYTQAKKAILYDPNAHKIIDVAPVNIGSDSAQQAQARIVIRNGTTTTGLGSKIETAIKKDFPQANITQIENASKSDYEKTVVVILNDGAKDSATALAKTLNVSTGSLPQGESKPDADILVIIGKDKAS
jgi:hypothetical protein